MINSGFFIINKPKDITSFDLIRKLRKITHIRKMGHAGTLDPFATGLMIIAFGNATRTLSFLDHSTKTYKAKLKFGIKTNTSDFTGEIIEEDNTIPEITPELLKKQITTLTTQIPSKFSAIKIDGKKAYELARKNLNFEMKTRNIKIHDFKIVNYTYPYLEYITTVSAGTYIRTLSEQIAELYQTIATTVELERTMINSLSLDQAVNLDSLNEFNWQDYACSYKELFTDLNYYLLDPALESKYLNGVSVEYLPNGYDSTKKFVVYNNANICLGFSNLVNNQLKPLIVFNNYE